MLVVLFRKHLEASSMVSFKEQLCAQYPQAAAIFTSVGTIKWKQVCVLD